VGKGGKRVEWEAAATALLGATLVGYATGAVTGLALGRWAARARVLGFSLAAVSSW
jgi:hypothetical protein